MTRYWWVNHKQTVSQEINGQYLWSPKTESGGARSQFYDNMRRASPGDLVLSYANRVIKHVGRVADFAFTSPKPEEFGRVGAYWSREGWYLPVFWLPLKASVRPSDFIPELGPLLPTRYSPIGPTSGLGNQKAYLAEIPRAAFEAVIGRTLYDSNALERGGRNSLNFETVTGHLDDLVEAGIKDDLDLENTVKESVILARRGQGKFRQNVAAIEPACRLTGIDNPIMLIASHIKPWRACASADERLDCMNGFLLTPDADYLFDRGFISFKDEGDVMVSPRVDTEDLRRLGFEQLAWQRFGVLEAPVHWNTVTFASPRRQYLDYHRKQVFVS